MSDETPDPRADEEDAGRPDETDGETDDGQGAEDSEAARKPISIREAMPPPGLRGQKPRPRSRRQDKRERRPEGALDGGTRRPTPVREVMDAVPPEIGPSSPTELPSRSFETVEDEEWIVRISGTTVTGVPSDTGVPLLHLTFYRADAPETPLRRVLAVGRALDDLAEDELREHLERARPVDEGE